MALNYADILGNYAATQASIEQDYNNLYGTVTSTIQGTDQAQLNAAKNIYDSAQGKILAGNVAKGLGNSTIQGSMETGLASSYNQATTSIRDQFAQLLAGWEGQIGLAKLGERASQAQQLANLGIGATTAQNQLQLGYAGQRLQQQLAAYGRGGIQGGGGGGGGGSPRQGGGYSGAYADPGITYAAGASAPGPGFFTGGGGVVNTGGAGAAPSPYVDLPTGGFQSPSYDEAYA